MHFDYLSLVGSLKPNRHLIKFYQYTKERERLTVLQGVVGIRLLEPTFLLSPWPTFEGSCPSLPLIGENSGRSLLGSSRIIEDMAGLFPSSIDLLCPEVGKSRMMAGESR